MDFTEFVLLGICYGTLVNLGLKKIKKLLLFSFVSFFLSIFQFQMSFRVCCCSKCSNLRFAIKLISYEFLWILSIIVLSVLIVNEFDLKTSILNANNRQKCNILSTICGHIFSQFSLHIHNGGINWTFFLCSSSSFDSFLIFFLLFGAQKHCMSNWPEVGCDWAMTVSLSVLYIQKCITLTDVAVLNASNVGWRCFWLIGNILNSGNLWCAFTSWKW